MLTPKFTPSVIKISNFSKQFICKLDSSKALQTQTRFSFSQRPKHETSQNSSQLVNYVPIRPLKKYLTPLYVQKRYLNKGQVMRRIPFWPFLTPFYAMLINNFLTEWSFMNCTIASVLFFAGLLVRQSPSGRREKSIIKMECTQDMSKLYITVPFSVLSHFIRMNFSKNYDNLPDPNLFTDQQLKGREYQPTQADRRTFTQEELQKKKWQQNDKLFKKIMKEEENKRTISRFQLDSSKTFFKLSNVHNSRIRDSEISHAPVEIKTADMFNVPYKYLIVRTEFHGKRKNKPYHFYIDLQENGDPKYHDYLTALGANFKISLNSQMK